MCLPKSHFLVMHSIRWQGLQGKQRKQRGGCTGPKLVEHATSNRLTRLGCTERPSRNDLESELCACLGGELAAKRAVQKPCSGRGGAPTLEGSQHAGANQTKGNIAAGTQLLQGARHFRPCRSRPLPWEVDLFSPCNDN